MKKLIIIPAYNEEGNIERTVNNIKENAPEFDYVQRGTDITYEHISGMQVHYNLAVSFVDFRLPFFVHLSFGVRRIF